MTNATLFDRLKHLEANGLVKRRSYQLSPERFEYRPIDPESGKPIATLERLPEGERTSA